MDEEICVEIVKMDYCGEIHKDKGSIYTEKELAVEVIRDTMMKNGSELVRTGIFRASRKMIAAWVDTRVRERVLFDSYDQWRRDRERRIEARRELQGAWARCWISRRNGTSGCSSSKTNGSALWQSGTKPERNA